MVVLRQREGAAWLDGRRELVAAFRLELLSDLICLLLLLLVVIENRAAILARIRTWLMVIPKDLCSVDATSSGLRIGTLK